MSFISAGQPCDTLDRLHKKNQEYKVSKRLLHHHPKQEAERKRKLAYYGLNLGYCGNPCIYITKSNETERNKGAHEQ